MRRRRLIVPIATVVAAALVAGYAAQRQRSRAVVVEATAVEEGEVVQTVSSISASVQPSTEIVVAAERSGRVSALPTRLGGRVKKGDVVAVIADCVLETEISEAAVAVERAGKKLERDQALTVRDLIPARDLETANFDYKAAAARLETLQARRRLLTVHTPINGTITTEHVRPGEFIGAAASGDPRPSGFPIVTIAQLDGLVVKAYIDEADILKVRAGQASLITIEALHGEPLAGVVRSVAPSPAPRATGTAYEVVVEIAQRPDNLVAGVRATARVVVARATQVVRAPREAVFPCDASRCVFVPDGEIVRRRRVELGITDASHVEIRSGLAAGDHVLIGFPENLRDGARVALRGGSR